MAKFCSNCGAQVQENAKFCASCGQALAQPQVPPAQPVQQPDQPAQDALPQSQQPDQPAQDAPPQAQQATEQQIPQRFAPPAQPQYMQQPYPQAGQYEQPYAPAPKKKSKLPLILGIVGGVVAITVVAVVLMLSGAKAALNDAAKLTKYDIGGEKVKTINSLVGERKVTGVETGTTNGVPQKQYTYESDSVFDDLLAYTQYLLENGWIVSKSFDLNVTPGSAQLAKESSESGKILVLAIAYEDTKYAIKLTKAEGAIEVPEPAPAPESAPAIAAESIFGLIDSGTFHMSIVFVGGDSDGVEMELFKKDGRSAMTLKGSGMYVRRLTMDGKFYTVLDEYETVVISEIDPGEIPPVEYDSSQLTYVGESSGDWGGTTYPYSEYKGARGEQMFYFMDGNVLKGIRSISTTGNTVNCEIRAFDGNVPGDTFEWPAHYAVEDPDAQETCVGLWRYQGEDGLELLHLKADNTFFVDARFGEPKDYNQYTGDYGSSEGSLTLYNVLVNGKPTGDMEIPWLIEGNMMILGGEDDPGYYYRVPKEDEAAVLADPLAPYTNPNKKP